MKLNIKELLAFNPCPEAAVYLSRFGALDLEDAWKACERGDWMIWALSKFRIFEDDVAREFACQCAEHTLHLFEEKYPNDGRPRKAIEAARKTITDKSPEAAAARDAAGDAAWDAESKWQAETLRKLINPFAKSVKQKASAS